RADAAPAQGRGCQTTEDHRQGRLIDPAVGHIPLFPLREVPFSPSRLGGIQFGPGRAARRGRSFFQFRVNDSAGVLPPHPRSNDISGIIGFRVVSSFSASESSATETPESIGISPPAPRMSAMIP